MPASLIDDDGNDSNSEGAGARDCAGQACVFYDDERFWVAAGPARGLEPNVVCSIPIRFDLTRGRYSPTHQSCYEPYRGEKRAKFILPIRVRANWAWGFRKTRRAPRFWNSSHFLQHGAALPPCGSPPGGWN